MMTATTSNAWPLGGLARSIPKMDSLPALSVAACLTIAIFDNFLSKNYNFNFHTRYHNITSISRIVQYVQVNTRSISSNIKSFILEQNFRQKSQNKIFYFCTKKSSKWPKCFNLPPPSCSVNAELPLPEATLLTFLAIFVQKSKLYFWLSVLQFWWNFLKFDIILFFSCIYFYIF